jgi:uncharacterized membrane protein
MRRKVLLLLALAVSLISVGSATAYYTLYYTGKANVVENPELTVYLDSVLKLNDTTWDFGDVDPGSDYSKNLTVVNTGNKVLNVILRVQDLPVDWSLTWISNGTDLDPGESVSGSLILSVPSSASSGLKIWDQWIEGI